MILIAALLGCVAVYLLTKILELYNYTQMECLKYMYAIVLFAYAYGSVIIHMSV